MEPMTSAEIQRLVSRSRFGHLGLAASNRAYVIPIFYGYDGRAFYFHSHPGLKSEFIEETEEACFAVSQVQSADVWASVLAFGRVEPVEDEGARLVAVDALMSIPLPPEWGLTETGEPRHGGENTVIHKLAPREMTGRMSERPLQWEEREIAMGGM